MFEPLLTAAYNSLQGKDLFGVDVDCFPNVAERPLSQKLLLPNLSIANLVGALGLDGVLLFAENAIEIQHELKL